MIIKGRVSGLQQRFEQGSLGSVLVWTFRLERHDDSGALLPRVTVEMRGASIEGSLNAGDRVEIDGRWQPGEVLRPKKVKNRTGNSFVTSTTRGKVPVGARDLKFVFFVVFLLGVFAVVGVLLLSSLG